MHKYDDCFIKEITLPECCDSVVQELSIPMTDTGKVLSINLILKHVLANTNISVGVFVFEEKILKGFKVRLVNTGSNYDSLDSKEDSECSKYLKYKTECVYNDVKTGNFYFILPSDNTCESKKLDIKIVTQYSDINVL